MSKLVLKAYAKINLGLDVLRKREDGYHEVRMVMQTVGICDELILKMRKTPGIVLKTEKDGMPSDSRNLAYKAAELLQPYLPDGEGIEIELKKNIPVAAGMAGGSTDAASVLRGMNELFKLGFGLEELQKMAVCIGADVPYCMQGGTMLAEGIGERLTRLSAAPDCYLVVAKPNISVSTQFVYGRLKAAEIKDHPDIDEVVAAIKKRDLLAMTAKMGNVLETVTQKEYVVIGQLKQEMEQAGAVKALMSGSGPTVFGIFDSKDKALKAFARMKSISSETQVFITAFVTEEEVQKMEEVREE